MEGKKHKLLEIHICTNAAIWKIKREIIYQWHGFTLVYDLESNSNRLQMVLSSTQNLRSP
jgi:hypothetical protein